MTRPNEIYAYIWDEMEAARHLIVDLEAALIKARRKATHLGGMLVLLRDQTCMPCKGKGQVWVSYAQDDTKLENCKECNGTGARDPNVRLCGIMGNACWRYRVETMRTA